MLLRKKCFSNLQNEGHKNIKLIFKYVGTLPVIRANTFGKVRVA